jgi:CheY-like chemotaxis protein
MILLVEDEEDDVFFMEWALQKVPHAPEMRRVANGREAIEYLQGSEKYADRTQYPLPDAVFLDLKLPFVNGFQVLEWIRSQIAYKNLFVAILSSSLEPADREKAARLGSNVFLGKPPTAEALVKVFRSVPALDYQ